MQSEDSAFERDRQPATCYVGPEVRAMLGKANSNELHPDLPIMKVWPVETLSGIRVMGRCPRCGRVHAHGVSSDPIRVAHCGTSDAPTVRLRHLTGAPPTDIWNEFWREPVDCGTLALAALRRGRWRPERLRTAYGAILASGVIEERIAICADGGDERAAQRQALARFIRSCRGRRMRLRLASALERARHEALRGETCSDGPWPPRHPDGPVAVGVAGRTCYFRRDDGTVEAFRGRQLCEPALLRLADREFWEREFAWPGRRKGFDRRRAVDYAVRLAIAAGPYVPEPVGATP